MNRKEEMDLFIKKLAAIYKENPNLNIEESTIYYKLMDYGIPTKDLENKSIRHLFDNWCNKFKKKSLNVYHDIRQSRFLQFRTSEHECGKEYKMYLSFRKDKIEECVNIIFKFIDKNKIDNASKVADEIRSDSVVLRLSNINDVQKVVNFINTNSFLINNSLKTNPFLIRKGIIGFGYDDLISYNSTLSMILQKYFINLRNNGMLNKASINDFQNFLLTYYNKSFVDGDMIIDLFHDENFLHGRHRNPGLDLNNYEQVIRLIYFSMEDNFSIEQFYEYVRQCKNENLNMARSKNYFHLLNKNNYKYAIIQENQQQEVLLKDYINHAYKKYGSIDIVYQQLNGYINGKEFVITRDNNFRDRFDKYLSVVSIENIVKGNLYEYIEKTCQIAVKYNYNESLFRSYIEYSTKKIGLNETLRSIKLYLNGNLNIILSDNNFRNLFDTYISPGLIRTFCNNDLVGYIKNIYNEVLEEKKQIMQNGEITEEKNMESKNAQIRENTRSNQNSDSIDYNIIFNVALETAKKYGKNQLEEALKNGVNGDYKYFTNGDKGYRDYLDNFVSQQEFIYSCAVIVISAGYIGGSTDDIIRDFMTIIAEKLEKEKNYTK